MALLFLLDPPPIAFDKNNGTYILQNKVTVQNKIYSKIKKDGYISFAKACLSFSKAYISSAKEKILFSLIVKPSVYLEKIPLRFHRSYVFRIYKTAIQRYQPEHPPQGIENAILVHTNNRNMKDWIDIFNGKVNIYSLDCNHGELIHDPHYIAIWLDIANSYLANSTTNELEKL